MCNLTQLDENGGQRLCDAARRMVVELVTEGCSNREIQAALAVAGHASVSRQTIHTYRNLPEVKQVIDMQRQDATESGLARWSARVELLQTMLSDIMRLLSGRAPNDPHDEMPVMPPRLDDRLRLSAEARALVKQIGDMVDQETRRAEQTNTPASAASEGTGVSMTSVMALVNQALEQGLAKARADTEMKKEAAAFAEPPSDDAPDSEL